MATMAPIRTAADVVAASQCWLARWRAGGLTARHPWRCRYCGTDVAKLLESLEIFDVVDGHDHVVTTEFRQLSAAAQDAAVRRAMYPDGAAVPDESATASREDVL